MATFFGRLFGSRQQENQRIASQLQDMESRMSNLVTENQQLNALLSVSFRQQGGFTRFDTVQQIGFIRNGYNVSAAVYSIVSDIAQKGASVPLICYEIVDDNALKVYLSAMSQKKVDLAFTNRLKTKALRQVEYDNPIQKIIDSPNPDDNAFTFYETSIGFQLLCGNNYWYAPVLDMGADKGKTTELRIMPSQFVGIVIVQGFPSRVIGYELIIDGVRLLQSLDVIHQRYPNYDWSVDGQQHYGLPPLKAGWNTLAMGNAAETSMISSFNNGGPAVLIANESITPDSYGIEQVGKIKKQWNDEYSGPTNRNKYKLTAGKVNAIPLGLSPVDLDTIAADNHAFDKICNIFHVSSTMFNNHDASTESNVKQMIRDSWIRGVLPLRRLHCDSFNRIARAYGDKGTRYFVDMDLSGIADLQPDKVAQADWLSKSWWISPNEKRKFQDVDESQDPNMNKIYAPTGVQALDDLNIDVEALPDMPEDGQEDNIDNENE